MIVKGFLCLVLLAGGRPAAMAQGHAEGCVLEKGSYHCDWRAFREHFRELHTVGIEQKPMERFIDRRLTELAAALGKTVAGPEEKADVIFRIVPAKEAGIVAGPADQPLALLEVLEPNPEGGPAALLWVETYVGQADKPWPSIVTATADQFEARFHHAHR